MNKFVTIKIWTKTRRLAKIISGYLGEPVVSIIHRLLSKEAEKHDINA